jgi:hypothetical protein
LFRDLIRKRKDALKLEFGGLILEFLNALVIKQALVLELVNLAA